MSLIKRSSWSLKEASDELGISVREIKKAICSWPIRNGKGKGVDNIILSRNTMQLLGILLRTDKNFTYTALIEIRDGKLNVLYNGKEF